MSETSSTGLPPGGELILVAVRDLVLFPGNIVPLAIDRAFSIAAVEKAIESRQPIGIVCQKDAAVDAPGEADLHRVGTVTEVLKLIATPTGKHVLVRGRKRFRIEHLVASEPYLLAKATLVEDGQAEEGAGESVPTSEVEARVLNLRRMATRALKALPEPMPELASLLDEFDEPSAFADFIASTLDVPTAEKQELLETFDLIERIRKVTEKLKHQIEVLELAKKVASETERTLDEQQREFFLRRQLETIRKQLGEDEEGAEIQELRDRLAAAGMPPEVEKQAMAELDRLVHTPEASSEYAMVRSHLELMAELPWSVMAEERIDIAEARRILDEDHHDLDDVKKRIIEFLAVRKLAPEGKSPILCFVGPPGTGKTSVGQSIARATGRPFVRQSLGGVHDEAEIRGHRRTYIGALPGRIIQGIRKAGARNPVFMLDEVDKLSASFHGDPNAALLEVLDPEQNHSFEDHYLDAPFDLSQVLFITTANVIDAVPAPLRDRTEVIELPGYAEEDKVEIAKQFLVRRQREQNGLGEEQIAFDEAALHAIITGYTREAGVRQLERKIGAICRAVATRVAGGEAVAVTVGPDIVRELLGAPRYRNEVALRTSLPGVATGLAWTPTGGELLFIEATRMPGKGEMLLTGSLGEVMKESAQAALSLVRSRGRSLGIEVTPLERADLHIHIPAGAIPKDGPSAGVAIFCALVSLLTDRCVRHDVAMTGEISLRGLVLPVGGIKEKVLAALRGGVERVVLPELNRKDVEDVPATALERIELVFAENVAQVLEAALEQPAELRAG